MEGMRRAVDAAHDADIRICMLDAQQAFRGDTADMFPDNGQWRALLDLPHTFVVLNKADTVNVAADAAAAWVRARNIDCPAVLLSCATMAGWGPLMELLAADIRQSWDAATADQMPLTKARHRQHLQRCLDRLRAFTLSADGSPVLAAEELRAAAAALGRITGHIGTEDVLDALFSTFCIGK
ncbi:tRNA modification GTPase gtpbp3, mitochondrial [Coemansia spiralis]|nr:tRNA modification GTPase gtpbp3, mitochondrial [Coemansia spiralis]